MKSLRSRFERLCYRHQNAGIPNLMLYIILGNIAVYLMTMIDRTGALYRFICFDRNLILHGQIWRLLTYPLAYSGGGNILLDMLFFLCYYSLGRAIENRWGTLKFNLFYLTGVVLMDIFSMIFGGAANAYYLNMSLFLAYATLYPDAQFLLMFIIPVKAWVLALLDLILTLLPLFQFPVTPYNFFPLIALGNYFLFFGKEVANVIPLSWRINARRATKKAAHKSGPIPFPGAGSYQATTAKKEAPYTHKCTVCGRTDVTNPELEFRYCSKCKGYHCYCEDHINNHVHIQ